VGSRPPSKEADNSIETIQTHKKQPQKGREKRVGLKPGSVIVRRRNGKNIKKEQKEAVEITRKKTDGNHFPRD